MPIRNTPSAGPLESVGVHVNERLARALGLGDGARVAVEQNGTCMTFDVVIDEHVPDGCAALAAGVAETAGLGPCLGPMRIEKA